MGMILKAFETDIVYICYSCFHSHGETVAYPPLTKGDCVTCERLNTPLVPIYVKELRYGHDPKGV